MKKPWMEFVKNAGIVLAVVLAILQLWSWFSTPRVSLHANVEFASLEYPPTLKREFERISEQLEADNLETLVDLASIVGDDDAQQITPILERLLSDLSWKLSQDAPPYIPHDVSRLKGIYWLTVTNDSSMALNKVQLTIPHAALAEIRRAGQQPTTNATTDVITLGAMQPTDSVSLIVWTTLSPSNYYADDIRLTHDNGIGTVSVRALASPFGQWIDRNWPFVVFMTPMIIVWTAIIAIPVFLSLKRRADPPSSEDSPTGEADGSAVEDEEEDT